MLICRVSFYLEKNNLNYISNGRRVLESSNDMSILGVVVNSRLNMNAT